MPKSSKDQAKHQTVQKLPAKLTIFARTFAEEKTNEKYLLRDVENEILRVWSSFSVALSPIIFKYWHVPVPILEIPLEDRARVSNVEDIPTSTSDNPLIHIERIVKDLHNVNDSKSHPRELQFHLDVLDRLPVGLQHNDGAAAISHSCYMLFIHQAFLSLSMCLQKIWKWGLSESIDYFQVY